MAISTIFFLVVGVIAIALFLLPSHVTVKRATHIEASPADVFKLLSSTEGFQQFNPYKDTDPNLQITPFGSPSGVGAGFAFEGKEGKGTQTIIHIEPDRSVSMEIDLGFMGKPEQTFTLSEYNSGTQVTWGVNMKFGWNPMGRIFGLFANKVLGSTYERGLSNLNQLFV